MEFSYSSVGIPDGQKTGKTIEKQSPGAETLELRIFEMQKVRRRNV